MKREDLDRAFGATPAVFTAHIDETLRALEEEKPVKKFTYRTVLVAAMITLLLCGIAYAVVVQGQEWYYNNRFTALKENEPETYRAIMDNLTTDVPQDVSPDAAGLVSAVVQDYAWVDDQGIFSVSMAARPVDDKKYEIYPIWNLDPDGACADALDPNDPEIRTEHWLMTKKGFGLPKDVMDDPAKQLLLIDFESDVFIGDTDVALPGESYDAFAGEDGAAIFVYKYDLSLADAQNVRDALDRSTAADGTLTLRVKYLVSPFENGAIGESIEGTASFQVKTR